MNHHGKELPRFVRDLLASPPARGGGLNDWLFRVSRVVHPYRTPEEIIALLQAATASEPVRPGEIERAVERSAPFAWQPGQPQTHAPRVRTWPTVNVERRNAVLASGRRLEDLRLASPVHFDDSEPHTEEIIDALFRGNPWLCVGKSSTDFATRERKYWRGQLAAMQFIVPSPMTERTGLTQDGRESEHTLANTGPRRFLVIEQDTGTPDEQAAVILHLAEHGPLALVVQSGGKSHHAWFYCHGQDEGRLRAFMRYAVSLGADRATWTRSQFVRMPDGTRDNAKRQTVLFFNPEVIR